MGIEVFASMVKERMTMSLFDIYHPIQLHSMHTNSSRLFPSIWEGLNGIALFSRHFVITLISIPN